MAPWHVPSGGGWPHGRPEGCTKAPPRRRGCRIIAANPKFSVMDEQGPLAEGELDRGLAWAKKLADEVAA